MSAGHHDHAHHSHDHSVAPENVNTAFIVGISLNALFVVIEVVVGISIGSLSLLSDAGHNLADVAGLALSLLAFRLLKVHSTDQYTYGFRKTSILIALLNAVILLVSIGAIIYEAFERIVHPSPLPGTTIAIVAAIGIAINSATALMFLRDKERDLNIKSAYLHLMGDAAVSLGIVIGGILMYTTGWYWIDGALGIVISAVILFGTWRLLRDSLRLSLDAVPAGISLNDLKAIASKISGVVDLHHIHVWAMSTTENAMTAHLVLGATTTIDDERRIKHELRHELAHKNIHHVTLETEHNDASCEAEDC